MFNKLRIHKSEIIIFYLILIAINLQLVLSSYISKAFRFVNRIYNTEVFFRDRSF